MENGINSAFKGLIISISRKKQLTIMSIPSQLSAAHTLLTFIGNVLANCNTTGHMFRHLLCAAVGRYVQLYTLRLL
jgi:hypothetical protein